MAQKYYGIDRGDNRLPSNVNIDSSSTSTTDVEIRVDNAASVTKEEVKQMVLVCLEAILEDPNFPAI